MKTYRKRLITLSLAVIMTLLILPTAMPFALADWATSYSASEQIGDTIVTFEKVYGKAAGLDVDGEYYVMYYVPFGKSKITFSKPIEVSGKGTITELTSLYDGETRKLSIAGATARISILGCAKMDYDAALFEKVGGTLKSFPAEIISVSNINWRAKYKEILQSNGSGTFSETIYDSDYTYSAFALFDTDGDGMPELFTTGKHSTYDDWLNDRPASEMSVGMRYIIKKDTSVLTNNNNGSKTKDNGIRYSPLAYGDAYERARAKDYWFALLQSKAGRIYFNGEPYNELHYINEKGGCSAITAADNVASATDTLINDRLTWITFTKEAYNKAIDDWKPSTTVQPPVVTPPAEKPSSWAEADVTRAIGLGLAPANLQSKYTQATTRAEFCAYAVALYETLTGEVIEARSFFDDTNDENVRKMAGLLVVNGTSPGKFTPNEALTREQAATILYRLGLVIGREIPFDMPVKEATFADKGSIST